LKKTATIGKSITKAAALLAAGQVVAIPTETVYGLAGNALDETAVKRIFAVKKRPVSNPLIVHIASVKELPLVAKKIPVAAQQLAAAFWPGSLTLVLPKQKVISHLVTAGQVTVAVRVPDHALTRQLLRATGFPVAAPSANPFNYISPVTAQHVAMQLGGKIPYILNGGRCRSGVESTIIGFEKGKPILLRHGAITKEAIEACLGKKIKVVPTATSANRKPGMFKKHYSPKTPLTLVVHAREAKVDAQTGYITLQQKIKGVPARRQIQLSKSGNLAEAAKNLYNSLILLDGRGLKRIVAEIMPEEGLGVALNDRLRKAASQ
jgi:L-threonylcarbamoyladenylate synthase